MHFIELHAKYDRIKNGVRTRIDRVLKHGEFIFGLEIAEAVLDATPVFVDIDHPVKLRTAVEGMLSARSLRPRGVIAVDLFGLCADYDAVAAVAPEHGLTVIEDAAQTRHSRP